MTRQISIVGALLLALILGGTLGYILLERWPFFDAFYMTVITLTTVGFQEVRPLSTAGRVFTIGIVGSGVLLVTYSVTSLVSLFAEGKLGEFFRKREVKRMLETIKGHFIICGCGVVGGEVVAYFERAQVPYVVIEKDREKIDRILLTHPHLLFIEGDATQEEILKEAGIERAQGLLALVGSDPENVYVTLTARHLNPRLRIVARAIAPESIDILRRAGADYVICPQKIGALRLASAALRPQASFFLDLLLRSETLDLTIEEIEVQPHSLLCGKTLEEADFPRKFGVLVVAIKGKEKGDFIFHPSGTIRLNPYDTLIVIGRVEEILKLRKLAL
ncbi:MAG: potassium channel protein [Candidatus Caldatribacterium sp.]|uniref:potassium channel family protein n=1 Tax=Candidatus Caldatribacterium sp. TaxID=2282143 RepID=UPI002998E1BA|nr:potassium channel protein [Candidatus Caldatribacterium sp.]MCX7731305.1 potassium channel protein [Candidatus Caldatribacterium sp.]MDW8081610.1 potassium channel protein [Candidatus Calescibacterium sp.]